MPITGYDMQATQNMGNQIGQSLIGLARIKQQQAYQQQLMQQHQLAMVPQMMHQQAMAQQIQQKMKDDELAHRVAQTIGGARTSASMLMNPSMGNQQTTMDSAVSLLRGQGVAPQEGFSITREDMVAALQAVAQGLGTQQAMESPSSAASMMAPHNIGQGDISMNSIGDVLGVGMPKTDMSPFAHVPATQYQQPGAFNQQSGQFVPEQTVAPQGMPRMAPQANDATKMNALRELANLIDLAPGISNPTNAAFPAFQAATNLIPQMGGQRTMSPEPTSKALSKEQAMEFLRQAGGDKNKARMLAKQAGFAF